MRTLGSNGRPTSRRRCTVDEAGPSVQVPEPPQPAPEPPQPARYHGGPSDLSLLIRYEDHVARRLWFGEVKRGPKKELKVAGHGTKLQDRVHHLLPPEMEDLVSRSGLTSLQRTSLTKIDVNLVSAFVERCHIETSSFHMPFGEMTITLDDVASLLHFPIGGLFWYPEEHVTEEMAVELGIEFLEHRAASSWAFATRTYLMMLVGSTIFANKKTFTLVEARYLLLFRDLKRLNAYSWASAALCWITEYFPTLGRKGENWRPSENHGIPRAMRWSYKQGAMKVDELSPVLDQLTPTDVIWRPSEDHRRHLPFDELSLYRGFHYIPPPPLAGMLSVVDVVRDTAPVRYPYETVVGYLQWYYRVSHPQLVPPPPRARREVPVPVFDARLADQDWVRASTLVHYYLRQAEAAEDDIAYADLFEVLRIARQH
ncbi:protein MAIN-LIKE 2-like [Vicia villosa]|uniref:protein MAIN-LIKE 2-like n=1 Tax=Vicia villosa TaxID=3911 RepID=UPI00273AAEBD|nr:protein MAIN-LIKE 2-like [Vicia villosa]